MKKIIIAAFAVFCISQTWAEEAKKPRFIAVTGESEIYVAPDEIFITLGVETSDKSLAVAKEQNDARVKQAIFVAKKLNIDPKYIQTDYMNIEPRYREQYERRDFLGYFARKNISITLKDTSKFESLISAVLESGVNYLYGVKFRNSKLNEYKDKARISAVADAKRKAVMLAKELEQTIGNPQSVQEIDSGWRMPMPYVANGRMAAMAMDEGGGGNESSISLGQIIIRSKVAVEFGLK
ncbi:MAG: SIMPL domain-containing protein [Elusimicrobia bacterium]|nr:SIMPL domain-containing protein [Elusimicrobiota bacterium]